MLFDTLFDKKEQDLYKNDLKIQMYYHVFLLNLFSHTANLLRQHRKKDGLIHFSNTTLSFGIITKVFKKKLKWLFIRLI